MACTLKVSGLNFTGPTGGKPTVKIIANNTKIVRAEYNGQEQPVKDNTSTTFPILSGRNLLLLNLAGPQEDVAIVEDCGTDPPLPMGGYSNDFQPALGFTIVGT
ncbi:MAG: hypothetical protein WAN65_13800 [Candidatus Sulfotelmatobacter sp.]|jgi:hypothetical protein